ncbi:MAG: hypothetical protein KBC69_00185 [Candidatus Magasanikbacteria bacterium]|nr:hypothetical protein [Candidatus Magasanikbacteria bacterium]
MQHIYNPRKKTAYGIALSIVVMAVPVPQIVKLFALISLIICMYLSFKEVHSSVHVDDVQVSTPKWNLQKNDISSIRCTRVGGGGSGYRNSGLYFYDKQNNSYCIFSLTRNDQDKILDKLKANNYTNIQAQN